MLWILIDTSLVIMSLGAGVACILVSNYIHNKYRYDYLNSFMYYQILLFIFGLYGLLGTIFIRNVLSEYEIPLSTIKSMAEFIPYLGVPVMLTAWFIFLKLSLEMVGKTMTRISSFLYFGFIILSMLIYVVVVFGVYGEGTKGANILLSYSKYGFLGIEILTLSIAFIILFGVGLTIKHNSKKKMVIGFACITLFTNLITMAVFFFTMPDTLLEKLYMLLFFAGQLPAVIFLTYYHSKYFKPKETERNEEKIISEFIENYSLSKREWEIVLQICDGYTNGQIGDRLFISLQTVKDHVYHIYKKTGVKNRVQLVNLIRLLGK